jgi:mannosyltransferase OCH1-like enzyme
MRPALPALPALPPRRVWGLLLLFLLSPLFFLLRGASCPPPLPRQTGAPPLPRIIHQQWKTGEMPVHFAAWRSALLRTFPEHRHILWTDETQRGLVAEHYGWFLETYDAYPRGILRADAARVFILHRYGGLYLDLDYEVLVEFWDRLYADAPGFLESPYVAHEKRQNAFMTSPPGHAFWGVAWTLMLERAKEPDVMRATGPVMIDDAIARYGEETHLYACENWHRVPVGSASAHSSSTHQRTRNWGFARGRFKACGDVFDPTCQFGIHHGTFSWGSIPMSSSMPKP